MNKHVVKLPPASILIHTEEILEACEYAENCVPQQRKGQGLQFVLLTELSALLHLGEYEQARHLWHRHGVSVPELNISRIQNQIFQQQHPQRADQDEKEDTNPSYRMEDSKDQQLINIHTVESYQFFLMWNYIAKFILLQEPQIVFQNAKRFVALCDGNISSTTMSTATSTTEIRNESESHKGTPPFSFVEPLVTYVHQVVFVSYQKKIICWMEERYKVLSDTRLFSTLGCFEGNEPKRDAVGTNMDTVTSAPVACKNQDIQRKETLGQFLQHRGWQKKTKEPSAHSDQETMKEDFLEEYWVIPDHYMRLSWPQDESYSMSMNASHLDTMEEHVTSPLEDDFVALQGKTARHNDERLDSLLRVVTLFEKRINL